MKLGTNFRARLGSGSVQLAQVAFKVGTAVVLARLLGPRGYGTYAFALALAMVLQAPVQSGVTNASVRFTAVYADARNWGLLAGLWRRLATWASVYTLVMAIGLAAIAVLYGDRLGHAGSGKVLLLAAGVLFIMPLAALFGGMLRGLGRPVLGQFPEFLVRPAVLLLVLGAFFAVGGRLEAWQAMAMNVLACIAAVGLALVWVRRQAPPGMRGAVPVYATRQWAATIVPLTFAGGVAIVNNQVGVIVVGWLSGAADAGLFRVAFQGANLVIVGLTAINMLQAPDISKLYARGDKPRLQKLVTANARWAFAASLAIALLFILFGHRILGVVFGPSFVAAYVVLVVLCCGQLVNAASGSVALILNMSGHERDALKGFVIAMSSNLLLCVFLVPKYGAVGAAYANFVSIVLWNGLLIAFTHRRTGIDSTVLGLTRG